MKVIIYETGVELTENTPIATFIQKGKRIPRAEMDRMFAEASKLLKVDESKLVYDKFE